MSRKPPMSTAATISKTSLYLTSPARKSSRWTTSRSFFSTTTRSTTSDPSRSSSAVTSPLTGHSHTTSPICSLCSRPTTHSNQTSGTANARITGAHISFANLTTTRTLNHNIHNKKQSFMWWWCKSVTRLGFNGLAFNLQHPKSNLMV